MPTSLVRPLVLLLLAVVLVTPVLGGPGTEDAPDAVDVVVRGRKGLADALAAACSPAWADSAKPRPVAFVVDVSPNTSKAKPALREAFQALADRARGVRVWSIAALGERFSKPLPSAAVLYAALDGVLAKETDVPSTLTALDRSLGSLEARQPVVVYLADWRFEDDVRLEEFIRGLKRRGVTLSVVGSEAAFGRAWNDGIKRMGDLGDGPIDIGSLEANRYHPTIGRSPFGHGSSKAPWHGGDTAYPHAPYDWKRSWWKTEFSPSDLGGVDDLLNALKSGERPSLEDLARRVSGLKRPSSSSSGSGGTMRTLPLPSSFGPYGLMRAAGLTGGRYVLWSWNPSGRKTVTYDFGRCNLFPPDLRSRRDVKAGLGPSPWAGAMLRAWWALTEVKSAVVRIMPPLGKDLRTPRNIDLMDEQGDVRMVWHTPNERDAFVKAGGRVLEALESAARELDRALEKGGEPRTGPPRRYQADALLLRYVVREAHFEMAEALHAARAVPREAWDKEGQVLSIAEETWVPKGRDPETLEPRPHVTPYDEPAGLDVLAARKRQLERFRGTPFGETTALNEIVTFRLRYAQTLDGRKPDAGRSPSESTEPPRKPPTTPPTRPPGGGSGGSGPSTGR